MQINNPKIKVAVQTAQKAGDVLMQLFKSRLKFEGEVKGVKDIVTKADFEAEKLILRELKTNFPDIRVISEESDIELEHDNKQLRDAWIVDPLDGTRNFSIGNPNFVVSIGYVNSKGEFEGAIYYPILGQTFFATERESYLNGNEISVSNTTDLENSVVAFWDKREKDPDWDNVDIVKCLRDEVKVLRSFGASVLEKAMVATGQVDLYIGNSSSIFGAVAGIGLVRNAGGVCYNLQGKEWKLGDIGVVCGNKTLVKKALIKLNL